MYWVFFAGLLWLGILPFVWGDMSNNPVAIYNFVLPTIAASLLFALYVRSSGARKYCLSVTMLLSILAVVVAFTMARPQAKTELLIVAALLMVFTLDCAFSSGAKRYFGKDYESDQ